MMLNHSSTLYKLFSLFFLLLEFVQILAMSSFAQSGIMSFKFSKLFAIEKKWKKVFNDEVICASVL